jgi:predicted P-loop ATPase/GTPase
LTLSFVEKAFAIHAAYSKDLCNNRMRHYYDLSRLCSLEEVRSYVGTDAYRQCVIDVKRICLESFPDQAVPDENSLSNSPAFAVAQETFSLLEGQYKREAEIFFSEPPSLKSIFDDIDKLLPKL